MAACPKPSVCQPKSSFTPALLRLTFASSLFCLAASSASPQSSGLSGYRSSDDRIVEMNSSTSSVLRKLFLCEQVLGLTPEAAEQASQVELSGVVTYVSSSGKFFILQDATAGILVTWYQNSFPVPRVGSGALVLGYTATGSFAPMVVATGCSDFTALGFPEPKHIELEQAMTGAEENRFVEMEGYLRDIADDGNESLLEITTSSGEFRARVAEDVALAGMKGSIVRLHGVCSALANERRQLLGIEILVPSLDHLKVVEPAPEDPFSIPASSIASLRRFAPFQGFGRRIRTEGTVVQHMPGNYIRLVDGNDGLLVLSRSSAQLNIGDRIEVVGFPGHDGVRALMREAEYRLVGHTGEPNPVPLADILSDIRDSDSCLVILRGNLSEVSRVGDEARLTVRSEKNTIYGILGWNASMPLPDSWKPGCEIELKGVFRLHFDEHHRITGYDVNLRSPDDLVILHSPPWWTMRKALVMAGGLGLVSLTVIFWVAALRRQVRRQTEELRDQFHRHAELEAELERAQRMESLGVLAGGIAHDFNNQLTVIMGNLALAQYDLQGNAAVGAFLKEAERGAKQARDLTQQLLTFARGGEPVRDNVDIAPLINEAVDLALRDARTRCELSFARPLPSLHADSRQMLRAFQNLLHFASASMPNGGVVRVSVEACWIADKSGLPLSEGDYLRVTVSDEGVGIPADKLPFIFDPYFAAKKGNNVFGLATVYSIVQKHKGHVTVHSEEGKGTTFQLWCPASKAPSAENPGRVLDGGRILFMDDEEGIRRCGQVLLEKMGFKVTLASDGAECVALYRERLESGAPFDLVITDLTVPGGMGGVDAVRAILSMDVSAKAIVSSGYSSDPVMARYTEYGFKAVAVKPYDPETLRSAVEKALS